MPTSLHTTRWNLPFRVPPFRGFLRSTFNFNDSKQTIWVKIALSLQLNPLLYKATLNRGFRILTNRDDDMLCGPSIVKTEGACSYKRLVMIYLTTLCRSSGDSTIPAHAQSVSIDYSLVQPHLSRRCSPYTSLLIWSLTCLFLHLSRYRKVCIMKTGAVHKVWTRNRYSQISPNLVLMAE
jgi:hypothetical protein